MFDTAGLRTTAAFGPFRDRVPTNDAEVVAKLKRAGGIVLGKTKATRMIGVRIELPPSAIILLSKVMTAPTDKLPRFQHRGQFGSLARCICNRCIPLLKFFTTRSGVTGSSVQ